MRTIVLVSFIACFSSALFADITITGLKTPVACIASANLKNPIAFSTTCSGQAGTTTDTDYGIIVNKKTDPETMSPTACTQAGTENADLICKITQSGALDRNKIYIIKADETPVGSDTVKAWEGVTVGITNKAYVALANQTAQELKYEDDKFNFTVAFAADLGADLPTVKVNGTAVDCSVMTDKKKLTCLMKKDTFKEEDKEKPYIATITSVCGIDETATVTIKASASFYSFSKIALAVIALFLF